MKYVLLLFSIFIVSCSIHRDVDSSVQTRREEGLQLDVANVRDLGSVSGWNRLFQGGYTLRGNWKIYDTSAPQLPDGSFPVLAEGSTEENGAFEEKEEGREETIGRDSLNVSLSSSDVLEEDKRKTESLGGKTGFNWLNALVWGVLIGIVLIGFLWWKYGKKN